jgi:hypothetical protein
MSRDLTSDEKMWCVEQSIALLKEVGHGGDAIMRDTPGALQSIYQTLLALRRGCQDPGLTRALTPDEKDWCVAQAIAVVKEVGHGGGDNMRHAAGVLQSIYQTLCSLRRDSLGEA